MRIIGGALKGRRIGVAEGMLSRPTTDRVRESLFNILEHGARPCEGARVLDLFAGSGALGLEALSRGALFALFVEDHAAARAAIRRNVEALTLEGRTRIFRRDATKLGARPGTLPQPFDLIFCDPPYRKGLGLPALASALQGDWIAENAVIVLEQAGEEAIDLPEGLTLTDTRSYGDTTLLILEKSSD